MSEDSKVAKPPPIKSAGNGQAKAQRLAIDIADDDTDEQLDSLSKFGKNSPSHDRTKGYAELRDLTPSGKLKPLPAPQSARSAKAKAFQFPQKSNTPRAAGQAPHIFPIQSSPLLHKGTVKVVAPGRPKYLPTRVPKPPASDFLSVSPPSSSKPSSSMMINSPPTPKPKAALGAMVTQVQAPAPAPAPVGNPQEIKARADTIYREHLFQTFQALKFVRNLPVADSAQIRAKRVTLAKPSGYTGKKTAVFDLDETLVHCCDSTEGANPDVILPITFPSGEVVNAGINIRPYARECLAETAKEFEIIIFTASHQCYADVVLDYLDPEHAFIHHRLYRDNCIITDGIYIKDLRVLANRSLKEIVIVDNAAYSFGYQVDNGVPIISWHDDPYDRELFNLIDYLKALSKSEDIREVNRLTFHLATFYEDYIEEFMSKEKRSPRLR